MYASEEQTETVQSNIEIEENMTSLEIPMFRVRRVVHLLVAVENGWKRQSRHGLLSSRYQQFETS